MRIEKITVSKDRKLNQDYQSDGLQFSITVCLESGDDLIKLRDQLVSDLEKWLDEKEGTLPSNFPGKVSRPIETSTPKNGSSETVKSPVEIQEWQIDQFNKFAQTYNDGVDIIDKAIAVTGKKSARELNYAEAEAILKKFSGRGL